MLLTLSCHRTPAELKVLEKMPEMLEIMAITCCDDEPIADVSIKKDPTNPEMVVISLLQRRPASEALGWEEFSSSDL